MYMTVINNIEIDDIQYKRNIIKEAILNNDPIESKLHVVLAISNPCLYARRYILFKEFVQRMELEETNVILYVVEYAYKAQRFIVTDAKNPRHLQIRTEVPLWHKENMINMGVRHLLPPDWKAMAWIDADVEFENPSWALDTLKVLNGSRDIVQIFSHCIDMNMNEEAMSIFTSFGHQYIKGLPYSKDIVRFWHPGYAWACTRKAYEKMGGLYESAILGSGDNIMSLSLIQKGHHSINVASSDDYINSVLDFQNRVRTLRLGYVPGVIRHHFHGSKKNRRYGDRWQILLNHYYSPYQHVTLDERGVLIPTEDCPREMLVEILDYFKSRNEDECYQAAKLNPNEQISTDNLRIYLQEEDTESGFETEDEPSLIDEEEDEEDEDGDEDEEDEEEEYEEEEEDEEDEGEEYESKYPTDNDIPRQITFRSLWDSMSKMLQQQ
jgi:hypothetical protein